MVPITTSQGKGNMNPDDYHSWDDQRLVGQANTDSAALAALYRRHYPTVARYVARRVGNRQIAEDIVSETFLTMMRSLARYRWTGAPFSAWLYRLASTQIHRALRKRRWSSLWVSVESIAHELAENQRDDETVTRLREALLSLPMRYQTPLALHYLEEQSIDAIATILQSRPGTVKAQLSRGRELLKHKLDLLIGKEESDERRRVNPALPQAER